MTEGPRITRIESVVPESISRHLLMVRVHTDAGLIGCGETYHIPEACAAVIHDWMARRLLGADATAVERHWRFLFERASSVGVRGAEMRALSAIDLALWDILGQASDQPVYRLFGGPVRDELRVYNSLGHPKYGAEWQGADTGWPGYGGMGEPGPLADAYNFFHEPVALARELIAEGYSAMKCWGLDDLAHRHGGGYVPPSELEKALAPIRAIREAVGSNIEIMLDGHSFFLWPSAIRVVEALREYKLLWIEDLLKVTNAGTLAAFRQQAGVPISVSEVLLTQTDFTDVLERRAADYVMIDPTWAGGFSESRRIAQSAGAYHLPVSFHDCTGPLNLFAGLHLSASLEHAVYQESVRAHIRSWYDKLITVQPVIRNGFADLPVGNGIGTAWQDEWFSERHPAYRCSRGDGS